MASPTKGQIRDFAASVVWQAISVRASKELEQTDRDLELPDPFRHGMAVGQRTAWRNFLHLPDVLMNEAEGKSPYGGNG